MGRTPKAPSPNVMQGTSFCLHENHRLYIRLQRSEPTPKRLDRPLVAGGSICPLVYDQIKGLGLKIFRFTLGLVLISYLMLKRHDGEQDLPMTQFGNAMKGSYCILVWAHLNTF